MTEPTTALVPAPAATEDRNAEIAAQVVVKGDLAKLTEQEKMTYYAALCRSLGLNPLTRPFEFITLNGKLTLYAKRDAADQIRKNAGVTILRIDKELIGDIYVVTAYGRTPDGREDAATGAVAVRGLAGEGLANAYMKAETKAKRRLALSLVGLGFPTEEEIEDIPPTDEETAAPKTLAERAAEKAAAVSQAEPASETTAEPVTGEFTEAEFVEAPSAALAALAKTPEDAAADVAVKRAARVAASKEQATPVSDGLSVDAFRDLCMKAGKSTVAIGKAIETTADHVGARVKAMTDIERGVLADELGIAWRPEAAEGGAS